MRATAAIQPSKWRRYWLPMSGFFAFFLIKGLVWLLLGWAGYALIRG